MTKTISHYFYFFIILGGLIPFNLFADTIGFITSSSQIDESGSNIIVTVERFPQQSTFLPTVSVEYSTQSGTATNGSDFSTTSGILNWSESDSSPKSITIPIIDDSIDESIETFSINLSNCQELIDAPSTFSSCFSTTLGNTTNAITINDNDTPTTSDLNFSPTLYQVSENGSVATITVLRSNSLLGTVSVNFKTVNGSATAGADYSSKSGTLSWADQEGGAKSLTISLLPDTQIESTENFSIELSNPTNGALLQNSVATVEISDVPPITSTITGELVFLNTSISVDEGNPAKITISRINGSDGALSVSYETSDITATAGSDYQPISGTVSWADQESGDRSLTISTLTDKLPEPTEELNLNFSSNNSLTSTIFSADSVLIKIKDVTTDPVSPGEFVFSSSRTPVDEGNSVQVSVNRVNGNSGAVAVNYQTQDQSAIAGADYQKAAGTLNWVDGETGPKSFTLIASSDDQAESTEEFTVRLSNPTNDSTIREESTTILINDKTPNSSGTLIFSDPEIDITEGNSVTITVSRVNGTDGNISVNYEAIGETAQAGSDFEAVSGALSWTDQEGGSKTFTINIPKDDITESTESFNIQLTNAIGNANIRNSTATIKISDFTVRNPGELVLITPFVSVNEGNTAIVTVTRQNGSDGPLSINYQTINDSAQAEDDFISNSGTLTWIDKEQGSKNITITTNSDIINENSESFKLSFSSDNSKPLNDAIISIDNVSTTSTISLANNSIITDEGTFLEIEVLRQGGTDGEASVDYTTADIEIANENKAIAGTDYTPVNGILFWTQGDNRPKTIRVPITQDFSIEKSENFVMQLSNAQGASLGNIPRQTITINNKQPSLQDISGLTPNQKQMAIILDQACTGATNELIARCNEMLGGAFNESELTDILQQLIPDQISSMGSSAVKIGGTQLDNLMSRLSELRRGKQGNSADGLSFNLKGEPVPLGKILSSLSPQKGGGASSDIFSNEKFGFFIHGKVNVGDKDQTEREGGYEFSTLGVTAGMDYRFSDALVMGTAFGYANSDTLFDQSKGEMNTNAILAAFYGSYYFPQSFYLDWTAVYGLQDYEMDRNIRYNNNSYAASSELEGDQYDIAVSLGRDFNWRQWLFNSYARVEYQLVDIESYQETGGHGFALNVGEQSVTSFTSALGGQVIFNWSQPWGILSPGAQFEWVHQYKDNSRYINASFVNSTATGGILSLATDDTDRNYFNLGASLNATFTHGQSAFILYESRVGQNNISSHTVEIGVRMSF